MVSERNKAAGIAWAKRLFVAGGVLVAVTAAALGHWLHEWPVHHFGVVVPGAIYRSGQPRAEQWETLARRYRIRTVIDLRGDRPGAEWQREELTFCAGAGIDHVRVSIGPERITQDELGRMLSILADPARLPVLIHCEHGSSRTGVVVAAYRMLAEGWHLEAAMAESYRYRRPMNPGYTSYLRQLAGGEGCTPARVCRGDNPPHRATMVGDIDGG